MKLLLTNHDVVAALKAHIAGIMPALEGADIALDYSLSRGAHAQLSIEVLVGADAEEFRQKQDELLAKQVPMGRKKAVVDAPEADVPDEEEEEEEAPVTTKTAATRFKRPASGE